MRNALARVADTLASLPLEQMFQALVEYQKVMPSNLRGTSVIPTLMNGRPNTAIAVAWVIPPDLVVEMLALSAQPEAQVRLAVDHQAEILDQCDLVLSGLEFPAAIRAREAIACLRDGHEGPAQSHAANIFDSVILAVFADSHPRKQRQAAIEIGSARLPEGDSVAVRAIVDRLVLGPAESAFTEWFPERQEPAPQGFARHSTAHAAHIDGVFAGNHALIAIMLAASIVVHYRFQIGNLGTFDPLQIPGLGADADEK